MGVTGKQKQTFVLPVLVHVYSMEVVLPRPRYIGLLENFIKKFLQLIMSLPVTSADPAAYVLSGTLLVVDLATIISVH